MAPLLAQKLRRQPSLDGSFEAVYRRHVRDVYGFALSLLGDVSDAEDVTQTTFLNAYRALERGEDVQNMRAWLLAIAHNVCRQRFRTAARRPQEVELDPEAAEAIAEDDDVPSAEEIRRAMSQLSFNQRTVLVLREIEGLTYEEIANAMDLSLSAVETLLFRARRALREQLEAAEQALGCDSVQRLISLDLDGKLSGQDRRLVRAHLRTCAECARFARSQRARKRVMPSLAAVPLPASLSGAFQGGAGFVAAKVAAAAAVAVLVGGGALVETGVLAVPGKQGSRGDVTALVRTSSPADAAGASLAHRPAFALVAAKEAAKPKAKAKVKATDERAGKRAAKTKKPGRTKPAASGGQQAAGGQTSSGSGSGSGGSSGGGTSGGGGGGSGGVALPPPPPAVSATVDTVSSTVGSAAGTVGGTVGSASATVGGAVGSATGTVGSVAGTASGTVGGATGTVSGAVGNMTGAVGSAVQGAQDKVSAPAVSSPVAVPSLPPAPQPVAGTLP